MDDQEFQAWMSKQMAEYRSKQIPFIGYMWLKSHNKIGGGALYRLDVIEVQKDRSSYQNIKYGRGNGTPVKAGQKLQIKKTGVQAVQRMIKKLEREGKEVYTFLG